jgi:hypothetical protein
MSSRTRCSQTSVKFGGKVLHTSLNGELEARLQRELDAAHRKAQELANLERELGCEQAEPAAV